VSEDRSFKSASIISLWGRRLAVGAISVASVLVLIPAISAQSQVTGEYQIKAAFLYHFAEFVNWPDQALREPTSTLFYCTIGESDGMREALQVSLAGKTIRSHPVQLKRLHNWQGVQICHVLFIGDNGNKHLVAGLDAVKGIPVLTVGDTENFAEGGGMIAFCQDGNKIRFDINLMAANEAKLTISARLLSLAKTVIGTAGETK